MAERQRTPDWSTLTPQHLCLWSDQSLGWDADGIEQEVDDVDKEISAACALHWELVRAAARSSTRPPFNLQRVRVRLSSLHPALRDIEFWTLDVRSTLLLFIVLLVLVCFGAAIFA